MALTIESFMPSKDECAEALREARWGLGLICMECGSREVNRRGPRDHTQRYYCNNRGRWFNNKPRHTWNTPNCPYGSGSMQPSSSSPR